MGEVEFIHVGLLGEIYEKKARDLIEVLLKMDDGLDFEEEAEDGVA
jgi:hypothetical protein